MIPDLHYLISLAMSIITPFSKFVKIFFIYYIKKTQKQAFSCVKACFYAIFAYL